MFVVALGQAVRSALLTLIPATLISLVSWAFAGSVYANTSDPIRAGVWIYLGAHQIPMSLHIPPSGEAGLLTFLPLGALIFPFLAVISGFKKINSDTRDTEKIGFLFLGFYALINLGLAFLSGNNDVTPIWYWALAISLLIGFISMLIARGNIKYTTPIILVLKIWAILFGLSSFVVAGALIAHQSTMTDIYTVLQPGIIGGFFITILNILYIPNYLISTLSYFVGTGFALGHETLISPLTYKLGEIPALPILAAVPTGTHALLIISALIVPTLGALLVIWSYSGSAKVLTQSLILFTLSAVVIGYLGSGSLITNQMGAVGVSPWKFPIAITAELLIGVAVMKLVPLINFRNFKKRSDA